MAETHVVYALRAKQAQIRDHVAYLERKLEEARADLIPVNATLRLFELPEDGAPLEFPAHINLAGMFSAGELTGLCKAALAAEGGPLNTRSIAVFNVREKGWDDKDMVLRHAVAHRVVRAMAKASRRGSITSPGYEKGVRLWALPS